MQRIPQPNSLLNTVHGWFLPSRCRPAWCRWPDVSTDLKGSSNLPNTTGQWIGRLCLGFWQTQEAGDVPVNGWKTYFSTSRIQRISRSGEITMLPVMVFALNLKPNFTSSVLIAGNVDLYSPSFALASGKTLHSRRIFSLNGRRKDHCRNSQTRLCSDSNITPIPFLGRLVCGTSRRSEQVCT